MPKIYRDILEPKETAGVSDLLTLGNSMFLSATRPELFGAKTDPEWNPSEHVGEVYDLPEPYMDALLESRSAEDWGNKTARVEAFVEASEKVNNSNSFVKYGGLLAAGLTDPINFVPIGGAIMKAKSIASFVGITNNIAKTAVAVGTVGAVSNVAAEAVFDAQALPSDYGTAAAFGFVTGGTLGGAMEAISGALQPVRANESLNATDNLDDSMTGNTNTIEWGEDASIGNTEGVTPRIKGIARFMPEFLKSETLKGWMSPSEDIRQVMSRMSFPTMAPDGKKVNTTVSDLVTQNEGISNSAMMDVMTMYKEAKQNGSFKGSKDEWLEHVGTELSKRASEHEITVRNLPEYQQNKADVDVQILDLRKQLAEAEEKFKGKKEAKGQLEAIQESVTKQIDSLKSEQTKFQAELYKENMPKNIPPYVQRMIQYFSEMKTLGNKVDTPELRYAPDNKIYMPRQYNLTAVRDMEFSELKEIVKQGIVHHPENNFNPIELEKVATEFADNLRNMGFDAKFNDHTLFIDKAGVTTTSRLKGRKIHVDESQMASILTTNMSEVFPAYSYWNSRGFAIRQGFPELQGVPQEGLTKAFKESIVKPLTDNLRAKGIYEDVAADMNALDNVFNDLQGNARIPEHGNTDYWTAVRVLTQSNTATMGGKFGMNQLLEIPAALWATNFNRLFNNHFGSYLKEVTRALATDTGPNDVFLKQLVNMGHLQSLQQHAGMQRVEDVAGFSGMAWMSNKLMGLNHRLFKYNGMRSITAATESMIGSNAIMKIKETEFSPRDMQMFARWGLDKKGVKDLQKAMDKYMVIENGYIKDMGIDKMPALEAQLLTTALGRAIKSGVMRGDTLHLPAWAIEATPFKKIFTQFMKFPLVANETLLARGMNEDKAGLAATAIGAQLMAMSLYYLEEDARVKLGLTDEVDRKFSLDPSDEERYTNLFKKGLNYNNAFGFTTNVGAAGASLAGFTEYDQDVAGMIANASGGKLNSIKDALQGTIQGEWDDRTRMGYYNVLVPMGNFPIIGDAAKTLVKE